MSLDPVISARELAGLTDVVIFDCRQDARAYAAGHVPGTPVAQDLEAMLPAVRRSLGDDVSAKRRSLSRIRPTADSRGPLELPGFVGDTATGERRRLDGGSLRLRLARAPGSA